MTTAANTDNQQLQNFTFDTVTNILTLDLENGGSVSVNLSDLQDSFTDTNTTNDRIEIIGTDLVITDSEANSISIPLADIQAQIDTDTNTTNDRFEVIGTDLVITDSDNNTVAVPLADIAALVNTDDQDATEVNLGTPIDVDGDSVNETTVEEAIADIVANNALDLDIDPTNELTESGTGAPIGAPANNNPGATYLDTITNELYVYDGATWNMVTDNQDASEVLYDNSGTTLTAGNVQDALNELDGNIAATELTTSVVEGNGVNVTSLTTGNNTEYTVATEISGASGNNLYRCKTSFSLAMTKMLLR